MGINTLVKKIILISVFSLFGLSSVTYAGHEPPPPPPSHTSVNCSPGYWKNHVEVWSGPVCNYYQPCIDRLLTLLKSRGRGSVYYRCAGDSFIEGVFESQCLAQPCEEERNPDDCDEL